MQSDTNWEEGSISGFNFSFPKVNLPSEDDEDPEPINEKPQRKKGIRFCRAHKKHYSGSRCYLCKENKNSNARAKRVTKKLSNQDSFIMGRSYQIIWSNETMISWWGEHKDWAIGTTPIPLHCVRCGTSFLCSYTKLLADRSNASKMFCPSCTKQGCGTSMKK